MLGTRLSRSAAVPGEHPLTFSSCIPPFAAVTLTLVGGIVVEHDVDRFVGRHVALDGIEKADEFLMPVALHTALDDLAFKDVEGGEQGGGAVALVIVCHRGTMPLVHRQPGLGAIERLDLAFL